MKDKESSAKSVCEVNYRKCMIYGIIRSGTNMRIRLFFPLWCLLASSFALSAATAHAAQWTVVNPTDGGPRSLRATVAQAASGDTIKFAVRGSISLNNGEIVLDKNLSLIGPGALQLSIQGSADSRLKTRLFRVRPGANVNISGLTLRNGFARGADGATDSERPVSGENGTDGGNGDAAGGGAIANEGELTVRACE
jgi:hypothetical protein